MASNCFSLSKELALNSDINLACWCPTMDLCAVVSSDGQLHLHRMDWQLLWIISPEALVTALCWRPDGKQLAAGHANGAISILDVETGNIVSENKVHYSAVISLQWSDQAEASNNSSSTNQPAGQQLLAPQHSLQPHQRFKRLFAPPELIPFPPSSSETLPDPYDLCMEASGAAAWPTERPGLSLLCAGDARGHISLWLQGQVQVAEIIGTVHSLTAAGNDQGEDEQEAAAADGPYKLLHVVADSGLDQVLAVHRSPAGGVVVVSHTLDLLQQHQQPLQQCAALFSHLQSFLKAAVRCVEVCAQDWSNVQADFHKRFDSQLRQELSDQGSSITAPQEEFILLLAAGACTPPLQNFLSSTLGEAGLRRLARGLDSTASGLHTAVLERLMPLADLVLFLLGELRGTVVAAAADSWMGLQVDMLQQLELQAAALLLRLEQLRRTITVIACQYRAFFTWLLKTLRQLDNTQDPSGLGDTFTPLPQCQQVLAFLKGQFLHDVVGPELKGAGLTPEAQARAEARFYQGITPAETHQLLAALLPCCPQPTHTSPASAEAQGAAGASSQQQQQRQAHAEHAMPAECAVKEAAAACARPLAQQLQHLLCLCDSAFEMPVVSISPCIKTVQQLQLLPPQALSSPSTVAAATSLKAVALGPPLLQPKQCQDLHTCVACLVSPAVAQQAAAEAAPRQHPAPTGLLEQLHQQPLLLLVRLQANAAAASSPLAAEALLLQLQQGSTPTAWAFYKDQQLVLLLHKASSGSSSTSPARLGGSGSSSGGSSSLHLLDVSEAPWTAVHQGQQPRQCLHAAASASTADSSVIGRCIAAGALVQMDELPCRSRVLQQGPATQLAVSRSRGLACLMTEMQHLLLMDLEEDEDGDEDGEDMEDAEEVGDEMQQ